MSSENSMPRRTVLKGLAAMPVLAALTEAEEAAAASKLPRTSSENAGIDPAGVTAFVNAVNARVGGLHSFMLLRNGTVAAEGWWTPYAPQYPHMLYSLSKSFTSTAIGLAVAEGLLTVDTPVTTFFPEDLPAKVEPNLAAMRVKHLLMMGTGHDKDATGAARDAKDGNWVKAILALPVEHAPGSKFVYNSAATYLLSAIVQKRTGMTLLDYLTPRLFAPLGIKGATWESDPRGINVGGWGLSIKTEDIAKFGQLYLQKGEWKGKQVVPASWIEEATAKQISNGDPSQPSDWAQGYGYQFWRCRHGHYRGDGAFGQYCIVMPEHNAVLAITSGVGDMQAVMNAAWDHLLPAFRSASSSSDKRSASRQTLSGLAVPVVAGKSGSPTAERISGKTFAFETNEQKVEALSLTFRGNRCLITLRDARGEHKVTAGMEEWFKGKTTLIEGMDGHAAVRGVWTDDNTFVTQTCLYKTPYILTTTCKFEGDKLTMERKFNVNFGPTTLPVLVGHLG
jgi:CubicO group peptidase (beta-lactamase class C family)